MFKELNILKPFFEEPSREFGVRELARISDIAPATSSKELKKLSKIGILKERKERMFNLYKSNLEGDYYKDLKVFYNLRKIKESGFLNEINKFYLKPTIMLFGSAASGLDIENSDFDFLVISENTKEFKDSKKFEKKLNRKIQIFIIKNIEDLKNKHLINNILNGVKIQGEVKWI